MTCSSKLLSHYFRTTFSIINLYLYLRCCLYIVPIVKTRRNSNYVFMFLVVLIHIEKRSTWYESGIVREVSFFTGVLFLENPSTKNFLVFYRFLAESTWPILLCFPCLYIFNGVFTILRDWLWIKRLVLDSLRGQGFVYSHFVQIGSWASTPSYPGCTGSFFLLGQRG
jgi:hypothetical protein